MTDRPATATPQLDKIAAGEALDSSDAICWAMREIVPLANDWVGSDIELVCATHGWLIRYTHLNNYKDRLLDVNGHRFANAEDAIAALVELCQRNKEQYEAEEARIERLDAAND